MTYKTDISRSQYLSYCIWILLGTLSDPEVITETLQIFPVGQKSAR